MWQIDDSLRRLLEHLFQDLIEHQCDEDRHRKAENQAVEADDDRVSQLRYLGNDRLIILPIAKQLMTLNQVSEIVR